MCGWVLSSPYRLTRLSGSSDSWPRNKSRIGPFLNGFEWKLAIRSGTIPREDTGEEPSWVYKKPHIKSGTHVKATFLTSQITVRTSLLKKKKNITTVILGSWWSLFPHYQSMRLSNKYETLLEKKKESSMLQYTSEFHSFLRMNSVPLYIYTTVCIYNTFICL